MIRTSEAAGLSPWPPLPPVNWKPCPFRVGVGPTAPFGTMTVSPFGFTTKLGDLAAPPPTSTAARVAAISVPSIAALAVSFSAAAVPLIAALAPVAAQPANGIAAAADRAAIV